MDNIYLRAGINTVVKVLGIIILLVGCLVITGWMFDIPLLKSLNPNWFAMKMNAAIGFVLSGIVLLGFHKWEKTSKTISVIIALIGFCTLLEYIFPINLGIDQIFIKEKVNAIGTIEPGRMAIIAALNYLLTGLSFFLACFKKETRHERVTFRVSQILMSITLFLSLFSIYVYIICRDEAYYLILSRYILMALHAAITFFLISICFYLLNPGRGVAGVFFGKSNGSIIARSLIIPFFFILPAIFYLRIIGERAGWFSAGFGVVLMLTAVTVFINVIIFFAAVRLNKSDEEKVKQSLELAKAKEKVDESDKIYKSIIQTTMDGFLMTDMQFHLLKVNEAYCKMSGYNEQELLTMNIKDLAAKETTDETVDHFQRLLLNGSDCFETKHRRKDGSIYEVEINIQNKSGEIGQIVVFIKDVTTRKISEKALKESEEKFRYYFENSPLGKSMTGIDGSLKVNNAFCKMLGYTEDELLKKSWRDITHPDDIEENERVVKSFLDGRKESYRFEKRYLHKNGDVVMTEVDTTLHRETDGKPKFFITSINNITERKQAEKAAQMAQEETSRLLEAAEKSGQILLNVVEDEKIARDEIKKLNEGLEQRVAERTQQLEAANKELEAFSYSVSHDLRAPLRHINGYVDLLTHHFADSVPEQGKDYLNTIADSAKQMGVLIDDLLMFSRTGRQEMRQSFIDMKVVFDEVLKIINLDTKGRQINWITTNLPHVYCDPSLIKQVWINLLSNAVKFTQKKNKTVIEVGYKENEKEFEFYVRDNGVGFNMKYANKLFGVFQRLHSKKEFEGTGIGLANVQRIILRHGGRVWAEAEQDNGATFYFTLPKQKEGKS
jgi:PAS domain S-box-containing protein